jgi:hypothetical protein
MFLSTINRKIKFKMVMVLAIIMVLGTYIVCLPQPAESATGDFSIDFCAAAPYSYDHLTGGGAYDDGTVGTNADVVESLEGGDFKAGDIVTYFAAVTVDDTDAAAADAPQTIEMDFSFLADTTGQSGAALGDIVAVQVNYGTIQDLIAGENTIDDGIRDDGGSVATLIDEELVGTMFDGGVLNGTVELTDLERNEQVIVRIDVKLFWQPGSNPTGNLQADLQAAWLTYIDGTTPVDPPAAIPGGAQTVPFKQIGDIAAPAIDVQKTVCLPDEPGPGVESLTIYEGEQVKYYYVVTNPSNTLDPPGAPLYNVTLTDDNGTPSNPADDFPVTLTGLTDVDMDGAADDLAAGGTATGYSPVVTYSTADTIVNTATATGNDSIVSPALYTDTDIATVTVLPPPVVAPMPRVIKGNEEGNDNVATLNEPGGSVTINVVVYNDAPAGTGDATLTSLVDDIYGDITSTGHNGITATTLATGDTIPGGGSYSGSFTVDVTGEPATIVDTLTATLQNTHSSVSDNDQANIVITNVLPVVDLVKDVTPASLAEPGGAFNYTLTITNNSVENVTITALTDDNPLPAECSALIGQVLTPGQAVSCTYSVTHTEAGAYPNTASVSVVDNEGNTASDSDSETVIVTDVLPVVDLVKDVTPASLAEPGGAFNYTLTITNNSVENVTITALTDDNPLPAECSALIGQVLTPGQTVSCTYSVTHTEAGAYPNTASVSVADNEGNTASDSDSETVTVTDVLPTIEVIKDANPTTIPETGGWVTFTFTVKNTSIEPVTITSLSDTVFGTLAGDEDCHVGTVLPVGGSSEFSIDVWLEGDTGIDHYNVFTAKAVDNDNNGAEASDDYGMTVAFQDVLPDISITKTADPTSVPETGGNVEFTIVITNNSLEDATIDSLVDDVFDLTARCPDAVGTVLASGETYTCTFTEFVAGDHESGISHENTATVTASDDDGNTATASDDATVDFTDVTAVIDVEKYVSVDNGTTWADADSPAGPYATEGDPVQFKFVVTNNGTVDLSNISLTDSDYDLSGCTIPTQLAAGASFECVITVTAVLGQQTDTATASGSFTDGAGATLRPRLIQMMPTTMA